MVKEIKTFADIEIEKRTFHHRKNLILLKHVDIDNIQVSSMVFPSEKNINVLLVIKMMIITLNNYT